MTGVLSLNDFCMHRARLALQLRAIRGFIFRRKIDKRSSAQCNLEKQGCGGALSKPLGNFLLKLSLERKEWGKVEIGLRLGFLPLGGGG